MQKKIKINHHQFMYPLTHLHAKNIIKNKHPFEREKQTFLILTYNPTIHNIALPWWL